MSPSSWRYRRSLPLAVPRRGKGTDAMLGGNNYYAVIDLPAAAVPAIEADKAAGYKTWLPLARFTLDY